MHWDTKLLPDITGSEKVDRMPVVISQKSGAQLLSVPKIGSGSAIDMADGVFTAVKEWNIQENIIGLSFDLTNANSGQWGGAAFLLERLFGRSLLKLGCQHHLYEIMLRAAYEAHFGATSAPTPPIFERFRKDWPTINQSNFEPGIRSSFIKRQLEDISDDIIEFCQNELENKFVRDDYKELLVLTLIFLGEDSGQIRFRPPGAMHHARWMSKAIYALKMFMFSKVFSMSEIEKEALILFCLFIIRFYVRAWTRCTHAMEAPLQDLNFLKEIDRYSDCDPKISAVILNKFRTHLWYLAEETIALAFFDDNISHEQKRKMVETLHDQPPKNDETRVFRLIIPRSQMSNVQDWELHEFITENTITFFDRFKTSATFLNEDPADWKNNDDYKEMQQILSNLQVVNDHAERSVKLFTDFNKSLTKDEKAKQYVLQVVNKYRKDFPGHSKSELSII